MESGSGRLDTAAVCRRTRAVGVVDLRGYIRADVAKGQDGQRRSDTRNLGRGGTGKAGVVAVMRKILLQLNAVARRGTPWVPQAG